MQKFLKQPGKIRLYTDYNKSYTDKKKSYPDIFTC